MKTILQSLLIGCFLLGTLSIRAQSKTTTVIVVRHAEKDTSAAGSKMMSADPPLSEAGKVRAENLVTALKDFTPDAVYSTNYDRTRSTVTPLAKKFNLSIQFYDPKNQQAFAVRLKAMAGKTIVVAGHSNTVSKLVNLLASVDKYQDLADSVYDLIYIVRITDGVPTVEIKRY
jgi:2,3-bisphosphoglycerate-dependent phosphoglycerate mutase